MRKIDASNFTSHAHLCHDGNGAAGSTSAVPRRANCPSGTLQIQPPGYKDVWVNTADWVGML